MKPNELLAANPEAIAHERTIETDQETLATAHERGLDDGWGAGALVERNGEVLLVRQDDQWFLPGGQVEKSETLREAAQREFREETGYSVQLGELLAVSEKTFMSEEETLTFQFATYRGELTGGHVTSNPGLPGEAIESVGWHKSLPQDTYDRDLVVRLRSRDS